MITLKTLPDASAQDVFNQVAFHLLSQGECAKDVDEGDCMYRDQNGLSCAAGCLISDEEYDYEMEWNGWIDLVDAGLVPKEHVDLIRELQHIHDLTHPDDWAGSLSSLARKLDLTIPHKLSTAMQSYAEEQQRIKTKRENTMTKQIKTDNEWRSMAVNPDTKKKTLVILNHHFNSEDVVPLSVSTPNMIEAVEAGFTHTLRGFQGKVFISLREAEDVRIQGDEVYSHEEVQYRYGYIVSEVNA